MSTIAFIQARMGSTRLPGKVMMPLAGKPVLAHVIERVQSASGIDEVVVLTTFNQGDLPIVSFCAEHGIRVFCGSEHDVLDRFWQAAKLCNAKTLLRITADCPLMDADLIEHMLRFFSEEACDYANNVEHETWPDGLDIEVFTKASLEKAWKEARLESEREHVTPYIRKHPDLFKLSVYDRTPSLSGMRWTLDQNEDYAFISRVFEELGRDGLHFTTDDILHLLQAKPEILKINNSILRNEGYILSLSRDTTTE